MKRCQNCGAEIHDLAKKCPRCKKFQESEEILRNKYQGAVVRFENGYISDALKLEFKKFAYVFPDAARYVENCEKFLSKRKYQLCVAKLSDPHVHDISFYEELRTHFEEHAQNHPENYGEATAYAQRCCEIIFDKQLDDVASQLKNGTGSLREIKTFLMRSRLSSAASQKRCADLFVVCDKQIRRERRFIGMNLILEVAIIVAMIIGGIQVCRKNNQWKAYAGKWSLKLDETHTMRRKDFFKKKPLQQIESAKSWLLERERDLLSKRNQLSDSIMKTITNINDVNVLTQIAFKAARSGNVEILDFVMKKGVPITIMQNGESLTEVALRADQSDVVEYLVNKKNQEVK